MIAPRPRNPWRRIKTRKGLIPRAEIRRVVERIVRDFDPHRVYLFGSYAYGRPHRDSDIDLLIIMPAKNTINQGARIHYAADAPFALDVIVRTPRELARGLQDEDWFLREVVERGIVCHEKIDA
jgi:predicted nucleotidyltransferase